MIKFDVVSIKYIKDYYSLYNINFEIESNIVLLGDETSGNNFVLRLISKIDKNYEGEIFLDGKNLKDIKDKDLNLAYVPKEIYLFKNKNIFYNLYYPLKMRKIGKQIAIEKILATLKKFDVKNFIFHDLKDKQKDKLKDLDDLHFYKKVKVKNLSLSAQKTIMLLRAVTRKPKYILCENLFTHLSNTAANSVVNVNSNLDNQKNLDFKKSSFALFKNIFNNTNSIFVLSENINPNLKDFKIINFDAGSIKK